MLAETISGKYYTIVRVKEQVYLYNITQKNAMQCALQDMKGKEIKKTLALKDWIKENRNKIQILQA